MSQYLLSCSHNDIAKLGDLLRQALQTLRSLDIDKPELSKSIINDISENNVFVHSDLTGDNVLYDGKSLAIIDYEDWQFAPWYTELPAIVFEMIQDHIDMAPIFLNMSHKELKDRLLAGIKAHRKSQRFTGKYARVFMEG